MEYEEKICPFAATLGDFKSERVENFSRKDYQKFEAQVSDSDFSNTCHAKTRPDGAPTQCHGQEMHPAVGKCYSGSPGGGRICGNELLAKQFCS